MSERFSLKDHLFNKESVTYFADLFYAQNATFPKKKFIVNILNKFPELELKQRITCIRNELEETLPKDYTKALKIILKALPPELDSTKTDDDFGNFVLAPLAEFVAYNGCTKEHLDISLEALEEMTKRFSAEDAIRYFINAFPFETMKFLKQGSSNKNYHVRRLSSEGTRPKLPWCLAINLDYRKPIAILDSLFSDSTRYVTRSVANHMNDISKIDASLVLETLKKWQLSKKQKESEIDFIIKHSLRTLLKQGHKEALAMLGYEKPAQVMVQFGKITKRVNLGEKLEFNFTLESHADQKIMISYYFFFLNKKNQFVPKVFNIKKCEVKKGEILEISKNHLLREMTTKKLYPGKQSIQIIVNGLTVSDKKYFTLNFK